MTMNSKFRAFGIMKNRVLASAKKFQVLNSIIKFIAVNMVDNFFGKKHSSQYFFHYKSMFKLMFPWRNPHDFVASKVYIAAFEVMDKLANYLFPAISKRLHCFFIAPFSKPRWLRPSSARQSMPFAKRANRGNSYTEKIRDFLCWKVLFIKKELELFNLYYSFHMYKYTMLYQRCKA